MSSTVTPIAYEIVFADFARIAVGGIVMQIGRRFRLALMAPFVVLAIVFDWLSALMHSAIDRLEPKDNRVR